MRNCILAAAASLSLCGSVTKAEFYITSNRQSGLYIPSGVNAGLYDRVSFYIVNDGTNGTGSTINSVDIAIYAPERFRSSNFPNNGLLVGVGSGARGSVSTTAADVFGTNLANLDTTSWIGDNTSPFNLSQDVGASVLLLGSDPLTTGGVSPDSQDFSSVYKVAGIAGAIFSDTVPQDDSGQGVYFAEAVVPAGDPVILLNPVNFRAWEPNSGIFSPGVGNFVAINNSYTAYDGIVIPEPSGLAMIGIGAAGLLTRRRKLRHHSRRNV